MNSKSIIIIAGSVLAILLIATGYGAWYHLLRKVPDVVYESDEAHFKYGAIGLGPTSRIPYWIWKVLPAEFPENLPAGGFDEIGLIFEEGHDTPLGFAKREIGFPSIEPNCSFCHTGTYRANQGVEPVLILAGPAARLDLQLLQQFLSACAADAKFSADNLIPAIREIHPEMTWFESLIYRYLIIPRTREGLLEQRALYAWQELRPRPGPGRTDTFNPTKFNIYHIQDDGTIGTVDLPQIWNQEPRRSMSLHWDGNNNKIEQRNYAAAMAVGAPPQSVMPDRFARVTDFLLKLQPPQYPFTVEAQKVSQGAALYQQQCARCHDVDGARVGMVEPIATLGTDRHRLDSFTQELVDEFHTFTDPPFKFTAYRKTDGYANQLLDGIWARAPYLHNGSVPNMWALLQPVNDRPKVFYRGYDVYDKHNIGFLSDGSEAEKHFLYDVNLPGNGNIGHLYGTELTDEEKRDLLEYLKTL